MNYIELLKSPKWQQKRLEIFQRDRFACRSCGDKDEQLHVHHLKYFSNKKPWDIPNEHLVTFCSTCHACIEYFKKQKDEDNGYWVNRLKTKEKQNNEGDTIIFGTGAIYSLDSNQKWMMQASTTTQFFFIQTLSTNHKTGGKQVENTIIIEKPAAMRMFRHLEAFSSPEMNEPGIEFIGNRNTENLSGEGW